MGVLQMSALLLVRFKKAAGRHGLLISLLFFVTQSMWFVFNNNSSANGTSQENKVEINR